MDVYSALVRAVQTEYDTVRLLKESARGRVALVRRRSSGERYIFRQFEGGGGVYRRLLEVTNPHLPVIYEAGSLSGRTAVLEEYVRGDTLAFLLEAGELGARGAGHSPAALRGALGAALDGRGAPGHKARERAPARQRGRAHRL